MPHALRSGRFTGAVAALTLAVSIALPAAAAGAGETHPVCAGYDTLAISPGLSTEPTDGTVNHVGELGEENCYGGDVMGYKPTGPIRIEHYLHYSGSCTRALIWGYALHHIPTAQGVKTIRNDFTANLFSGKGTHFSGVFFVSDPRGDCVSAPITHVRVNYFGYFNNNSRD